ncbi:hypothetical protein J6590_048536 [Homalodisca vitripennis]|nr:hypothetical protein J6590_048536 [Homalodisca vitripennis]
MVADNVIREKELLHPKSNEGISNAVFEKTEEKCCANRLHILRESSATDPFNAIKPKNLQLVEDVINITLPDVRDESSVFRTQWVQYQREGDFHGRVMHILRKENINGMGDFRRNG